MSAQEANPGLAAGQHKKFGNSTRHVPHKSQKAKKFYPAHDEKIPRKSRKTIHPSKPRSSLEPGTILILLAGRFRGKRVVLLKHLKEGALLITGPFKVNGVPLRRVNSRYVIATGSKVDVKGIDEKTLEKVSGDSYFVREGGKKEKGKSEEAFFKQGEKPEKKKPASARAQDQKSIDKALLSAIKKEQMLASYLASSFSLRHGQKPHEMKF